MTSHVLLNSVDHKELKISTQRSPQMGDSVMYAQTFPAEFRSIQNHYPIIFKKDDAGEYSPVALFGFQQQENLFLTDDHWDADYLPLIMQCQPFLIGFQKSSGQVEPAIYIDINSPRISQEGGEAVFLDFGGYSPYLMKIRDGLSVLYQAKDDIKQFSDLINELDLMESFFADFTLNDGSVNRFMGFYTINEEKLSALTAAQLESISKKNFLMPIYMQLASISRFRDLMNRKNKTLTYLA